MKSTSLRTEKTGCTGIDGATTTLILMQEKRARELGRWKRDRTRSTESTPLAEKSVIYMAGGYRKYKQFHIEKLPVKTNEELDLRGKDSL